MRTERSFDKWMLFDEDGFCAGVDPKAPEDVKKEYAEYVASRKKHAENGYITK